MYKYIGLLSVITLLLVSCSKESVDLSDHPLVGIYSGMWETNLVNTVEFLISPTKGKESLEYSYSSLNYYPINIESDSMFNISRFEVNQTSNELFGELRGDTLFIENHWFHVFDPSSSGIRKGEFVKVE